MVNVKLSKELDKRFHEEAYKAKGYFRGAIKDALEDAIKLWLKKRVEERKGGGN